MTKDFDNVGSAKNHPTLRLLNSDKSPDNVGSAKKITFMMS
jgi:hypothetical protein